MNLHGKDIKIFSGNSNPLLAKSIADRLELALGDATVGQFSDGEISANINEVVRGSDVFIVQSTSYPVNDNLMELLIMIDAMKRASAGRITAVIPYFGYARQDRKAKRRDPISARLVANIISVAGADRVLTMDLHAAQLEGFFDIPVDHLTGAPILSHYFKEHLTDFSKTVVVAPDVGGVARARNFAQKLNAPMAIIDKRRQQANVSEVMNVIGDVEGMNCILIDDIIDTAGTISNGAKALKDRGANEIYACCSHAVLSGKAIEKIEASPIKQLVTLDTINNTGKQCSKSVVLSSAQFFAWAIERIYSDMSISTMYENELKDEIYK